jgi:hypothetical protein
VNLSRDFFAVFCAVGILFVIVMVFPFEALGYRARMTTRVEKGRDVFSCAFVRLSPSMESIKVSESRMSLKGLVRENKANVNLSLDVLPEETGGEVLEEPGGFCLDIKEEIRYNSTIMPPTEASPELRDLPKVKSSQKKEFFSREELLRIY